MLKDCITTDIYQPIDASKPLFFDLIDKIWQHKDSQNHPLHRICSLFRKMKVGTVYVEELGFSNNDNIGKELYYIQEKIKNNSLKAQLFRISAFYEKSNKEPLEDNYLGYAAVLNIKNDKEPIKSYVIDSVVRIPMIFPDSSRLNDSIPSFEKPFPILNNYYHCTHQYTGYLNHKPLKINGLLFCQQNEITACCAHACLRMAINNLPFINDNNLITTTDILEISKDIKGTSSSVKITAEHLREIIEKLGYYSIFDDNVFDSINYESVAYPLMESGFPTIIEFTTRDQNTNHVITIVGHTLNSDLWHPEAEYGYSIPDWIGRSHIQSSSLTDHYIVMDDQFGPALCLSANSLGKKPTLKCKRVTGISRFPIKSKSYVIEELASSYYKIGLYNINDNSAWIKRLKENIPIFRLFMLDKKSYIEHMENDVFENMEIPENLHDKIKNAPDHFWFIEFSLPDLYTANKTKLGEIVIDDETNNIISLRYVGNLLFYDDKTSEWNYFDIKNISNHTPLLKSKLEIPCWEW